MSDLVRCEGCERHVRSHEAACPFCGHARQAGSASNTRSRLSTTSRAARMAFALASVATLSACYGGPPPRPADGPEPPAPPPAPSAVDAGTSAKPPSP